MEKKKFTISNPDGMYDPSPYAFSHLGIVPPGNHLIFVAGQGGLGAGKIDFESQCQHSIECVDKVMNAAGGSILDVVKFTIWIVDFTKERHDILIRLLKERFKEKLTPTCSLIPLHRLAAEGSLIEIEAVGVLTDE